MVRLITATTNNCARVELLFGGLLRYEPQWFSDITGLYEAKATGLLET